MRTLVPVFVILFVAAPARALEWQGYMGPDLGFARTTVASTLGAGSPVISSDEAAALPGSYLIGLRAGVRLMSLFRAELSVAFDVMDGGIQPTFQLLSGVDAPSSWPLVIESSEVSLVPTIGMGFGYGSAVAPSAQGNIEARGPFFTAVLRYELRLVNAFVRLEGAYRAVLAADEVVGSAYSKQSTMGPLARGFVHDLTGTLGVGVVF